jgi:(1->4)-alpha-D-glucan 1-alpha-D-glucosylmutase
MHLARSSYRLQLHRDFTFKDLKTIIPYLDRLGISTIYAAPFFEAMPGSTHGYDVINPLRINPEIGSLEEFRQIAQELKVRNMQWLQDIVPNHMAFSCLNPWMYDLLEKGPHSPYYHYFDVNWLYPDKQLYGKLMVPTLGNKQKAVVQNNELTLQFGPSGYHFSYYEHHFPACMLTYPPLLSRAAGKLKQVQGRKDVTEFLALVKRIEDFAEQLSASTSSAEGWNALKKKLLHLCGLYPEIDQTLSAVATEVNDDKDLLSEHLDNQFFVLCHWQTTHEKINYRRFFTVNDLICLNMQEKSVFDTYHQFIRQLLEEDLIQGLRVDHVDGLLDPTTYLERLRGLAGKDTYITVEKILEGGEQLTKAWLVEGSSGYDFLAQSNQLFTNQQGAAKLLSFYQESIHPTTSYQDLVFTNKRFILEQRMAGDLDNLIRMMVELGLAAEEKDSASLEALKAALGSFLVYFPVYRTYSNQFPFSQTDMQHIEEALELCVKNHPELKPQLQLLRTLFDGKAGIRDPENKLYFNLRTQQFTGPLAAKGVEDTTFYQYFPLISLNEVGDSPEHLGSDLPTFHEQMQTRGLLTMNTTATHDTKRGEDARLRLSVLSEMAETWISKVSHWQKINQELIVKEEGQPMPDRNDEYFIYQTLVATYPYHIDVLEDGYPERLSNYIIKALREAKVHTHWATPNEAYEQACTNFAGRALEHAAFFNDFDDFTRLVARTGAVYSLGNTILRITAPGVPDTYQGTEYWDLSMVDPDNRRPVNYNERQKNLEDMEVCWQQSSPTLLADLRDDPFDPRIKLFTLYQCLNTRKLYCPLFDQGTYQPVGVKLGVNANLLAFRRVTAEAEALVIIPLGITALNTHPSLPLGEDAWGNSYLEMHQASGEWHHVFLNQKMNLKGQVKIAELLSDFPVALLIKK